MTSTIKTRAVVFTGAGDVDVLSIAERAIHAPGPGEILVRVAAAGLNRADLLQRRGLYPAPPGAPADVPGLEYAGHVEALGEGVIDWKIGDRVMGIVAGGGMSTHLVVHAREAIPVPNGMAIEDAAAIPEVFLTTWDALFLQAEMRAGQIVLVHAAGSGIGTAAIQLARAVSAIPVGTSRTREKLERCKALGLAHAIEVPPKTEPAFAVALEREVGRGADVILDSVGASYLGENVRALATKGTIVVIGMLGGVNGALPMAVLLARRARVIGTVLRARPLEEKATLARIFAREAVPLFERGVLKPVVGEVMPMDRIADAHRAMERDETFGKIVMRW
ncbi:NAD(P)H-quinone oxidoreductase [Sandaracinus amylolyticus]|uniref:NAD(P)H-quinone oxidoreductase n=1 Tax=Sandaracinus amylolyticus TaxID=927083 RepID=UPI001F2181FC|nr:NAD(P)H-quinone oxidoreductase [Sandaracinus amylolyticus]UJR79419.1 NADPH quinone oxidoreductase [Sandaracinus amylolyticus]